MLQIFKISVPWPWAHHHGGGGGDIQRAALVSDGRGRGGMVNSVWSPELNVVGDMPHSSKMPMNKIKAFHFSKNLSLIVEKWSALNIIWKNLHGLVEYVWFFPICRCELILF